MIVLIISMLVVLATTIARSTGFMMDIAQKRLRKEQHYRSLQGLLNYGVARCIRYFDSLVSAVSHEAQNIAVVIQSSALENGASMQGKLQFKPAKKSVLVAASLFNQQKKICSARCTVKRGVGQGSKNLVVADWTMDISSKK